MPNDHALQHLLKQPLDDWLEVQTEVRVNYFARS